MLLVALVLWLGLSLTVPADWDVREERNRPASCGKEGQTCQTQIFDVLSSRARNKKHHVKDTKVMTFIREMVTFPTTLQTPFPLEQSMLCCHKSRWQSLPCLGGFYIMVCSSNGSAEQLWSGAAFMPQQRNTVLRCIHIYIHISSTSLKIYRGLSIYFWRASVLPHSTTFDHILPHFTTFYHIRPHSTTFDHIRPLSTTFSTCLVLAISVELPHSTTFDHIRPHFTTFYYEVISTK